MSRRHRASLIKRLEANGAIRTAAVREAFLAMPREVFIPAVAEERGIAAVYRDEAIPTKTDDRGDAISSSSQPGIMAEMLEELRTSPGQRILEVGAGTGYNAALLSVLAGARGQVTSIELDPDIAATARRAVNTVGERARIVVGDGREGWGRNAPFDRIIVTASSLDVPLPFLEQLKEGGLLVMPLRLSDAVPFRQVVVTFERVGRRLRSVSVILGGFMRLRDRPGDRSLPWPVSEVAETRDGKRKVLASLSGATLDAISSSDRSRLLALMLSTPRSRALGLRVSGRSQWGLEAFIALGAPEGQLVGCARADLEHLLFFSTAMPAVIEARGGLSLAHLGGGKSFSRIDAYGGRGAERLLLGLVDDWRRRGKPEVTRLHVEVGFGAQPKRTAWRGRRRGASVLQFDWS